MKVSDHRYCFLVLVSVFDNFTRGLGDIFTVNPLKVEVKATDKFEAQDLAAKQKFGMMKHSGKIEGGERVVWKTPSGDEIEECQFLKVADDPHAYCYPKVGIENFKAVIPFR